MTLKNKAAWATGSTFVCTVLVTIFREFEPGYAKGIWFISCFCFWNYFAYALDRGMWPWTFWELYGQGKGKPGVRTFHFWGTLALHFSFLALMAFAEK
jgi:hypothetical protein